jgi:hypothetical protein
MIEKRGIIILAIVVSLFGIGMLWYGVSFFTPPATTPGTTEIPLPTEVPVVTIPTPCDTIATPGVFIDPIDYVMKGTPTTRISGITSADVGSVVYVDILCDNYLMTPAAARSDNPAPYDRHVKTLVIGSGCGLHKWSVDVDTAGLRPGRYNVHVMAGIVSLDEGYSNDTMFYVVDTTA